jgi:hypothetical protein
MIVFNGISEIKDDGGDYIVLIDYGLEGLSPNQFHDINEAVAYILSGLSGPATLVKLIRVLGSEVTP